MGYETIGFHYGVHYSHKKGKLAFTFNKVQLLLDGFVWNTAYYEKKIQRRITDVAFRTREQIGRSDDAAIVFIAEFIELLNRNRATLHQ